MKTYQRHPVSTVLENLQKDMPIFQVIIGPRQIGKTTAAHQIREQLAMPSVYASADSPLPVTAEWIDTQWHRAKQLVQEGGKPVLLVLDEVQKVKGWSEVIKLHWDDQKGKGKIKLLILGSSSLLLQHGLTESLAGRFYVNRFPHWTWAECNQAFDWTLDEWLFFGGYPGSQNLKDDVEQWKQYISDTFVEAVIAKDVLQLEQVTKPTLMCHLFGLAATFPAQIYSYNKMLGQLQESGNTTTLAHYLQMLDRAFLVTGLELFSQGHIRRRGSSPKLVLWNNALINGLSLKDFRQTWQDGAWWGRIVENAAGAHLLNGLAGKNVSLTYWRKGNAEVDYVLTSGTKTVALEIKSGRTGRTPGLNQFKKHYPQAKTLIIGETGIPLDEFFTTDPITFLQ